jgi:hypothetical protein
MAKRRVPFNKGPFTGAKAHGYEQLREAGYPAAEAHRIMSIHQRADDADLLIEWEQDELTSADFDDTDEPHRLWWVAARDATGKVLDSLGGIDLGEEGEPDAYHSHPYQWDAEAQVLDEALSQLPPDTRGAPSLEENPRKNVTAVAKALYDGKRKGRPGDSIWTDGENIWSYNTCLLAARPAVQNQGYYGLAPEYVLNASRYSVTTSQQQNSLRVLFGGAITAVVTDLDRGVPPFRVLEAAGIR